MEHKQKKNPHRLLSILETLCCKCNLLQIESLTVQLIPLTFIPAPCKSGPLQFSNHYKLQFKKLQTPRGGNPNFLFCEFHTMLPQTFHPYLLANQSKAIPRVMYMDVHHVQLLSPYSQVSDSQHPHPLNMSSKLPSMEFCLHSLRAERKAFRRGIRKQEMQQQLKFEGKKVCLHLLLLQNPHRTCFDSFLRGTGPCLLDLFPIPEKLAIELLYFLINCVTSLIYLHTDT